MMKQDINEDLNTFLLFSDEVRLFKFKNNLRIILGSKIEEFKNIEARKSGVFS